MKIALMHFRVYETDGVSLEMDKWRLQLEKQGHEVLYISGSTPKNNDIYVDELDYRSEYNNIIHRNSFQELTDFDSKDELLNYIYSYAEIIENKLLNIIIQNKIDVIVPNNMSSLGFNLPVGIAIGRLAQKEEVNIVYHHHDFHWERERYSTPLFKEIGEILKTFFPYNMNAKHCVINHIAKEELDARRHVDPTVVPNVFDFVQDSWVQDEYNEDLRSKLVINDEDIVFLQATRIVERKAIELGYRVINEVNNLLPNYIGKPLYNNKEITENTKIHFVLAGLNELTTEKFAHLDNLLQSGNITIHYINDIVDHSRKMKKDKKIYSLWDVYTMCDFITYPSMLEGWGNQLLEGLFAKKPMLVYEYPVFKTDIKHFGFDLITIDSKLFRDEETLLYGVPEHITKEKAKEVIELLVNKKQYVKTVEANFDKGKNNLSYENLYDILVNVFRSTKE